MPFNRSISGLIAKYRFYREAVVWVEGRTDVPVYERVLRNYQCRIEVAGGKLECRKLAAALIEKNYPYVVVLDGDYDILRKTRSAHRRVVLLHRYSVENYLFEKEPIAQVCRNYAGIGSNKDPVGRVYHEAVQAITDKLKILVILDVAQRLEGVGSRAVPKYANELLESHSKIDFSNSRISDIEQNLLGCLSHKSIEKATKLVEKFIHKKQLSDLLRGHFLFGIIRSLVIIAVKRQLGRKPQIDNDGLLALLSAEVWNKADHSDHRSLRRRLRNSVREAESLLRNERQYTT